MLKEIEQIIIDCQLKDLEPMVMAIKISQLIDTKAKLKLETIPTGFILDELKRRANLKYPEIKEAMSDVHKSLTKLNKSIEKL